MISNCDNEWGQFVDLECGRMVPDIKTGLVTDTYCPNKNISDDDFSFTSRCAVGILYSLTYILNSLIPED